MVVNRPHLGPALRQAWVGYRRRLDAHLAAAGFDDVRLPEARVLHICSRAQTTVSQLGREFAITRQGAGKIVAGLCERGYVTLDPSPTSGREKVVAPTERARAYLAAHRAAVTGIEQEVHGEVGPQALETLYRVLAALGGPEQPRVIDYLRREADLDRFD